MNMRRDKFDTPQRRFYTLFMCAALKYILITALCLSFGLGFNRCRCHASVARSNHEIIVGNSTVGSIPAWRSGVPDCDCHQLVARTLSIRKIEIAPPAAPSLLTWLTHDRLKNISAISQARGATPALPLTARQRQSLLSQHCALII